MFELIGLYSDGSSKVLATFADDATAEMYAQGSYRQTSREDLPPFRTGSLLVDCVDYEVRPKSKS